MPDTTTTKEPRRHCRTCTCEDKRAVHLTVYPPNEHLYDICQACGVVRWSTAKSRWTEAHGWTYESAMHCRCCTHPHDLPPGGHDLPQKAG